MDKLEKISKIEAIALVLIVIANQIVLNIPNIILALCGSSSALNVIYISILCILFVFLICKLFKPFYNQDLLDISKFLGGNILKTSVGIIFMLFFILLASLSTIYLANSLKIIYFNNSPIIFISLFLIVPATIMNRLGLKSISGVNLIFIPIILITIIILLISSYSNFNFERVFPIFGNGINETFFAGATNIFAFTGLAYLYFINPFLKEPKEFKQISVISIVISSIYLFISVLSLLMTFPAITYTDEPLAIYLLTRMVKLGKFLERVDAIFIFVWIFSFISFLSLTVFYILQILKKITKIKNFKELNYAISIIILAIVASFENLASVKQAARVLYKYGAFSAIFIIGFIILILANIKFKKKNQKQE